MNAPQRGGARHLVYRILGVLIGGYGIWVGGTVVVGVALRHTGLSRADAMLIPAMLGSLVYVGVIIWGFGAPPRMRPATTLAGLGALAVICALLVSKAE